MFLRDKSLVAADTARIYALPRASESRGLFRSCPSQMSGRAYWRACVSVLSVQVHVEESTTRHSGAPELLRAAKPHLPPFRIQPSSSAPELSATLSRECRCETRLRARVRCRSYVSDVILRHCLDTMQRTAEIRSRVCRGAGDFVEQLRVVVRTFEMQTTSAIPSPFVRFENRLLFSLRGTAARTIGNDARCQETLFSLARV